MKDLLAPKGIPIPQRVLGLPWSIRMKISVVCAASPQVKMERVNVARCLGPVSVWMEHRQLLEPLRQLQ